MIGPREIVYGLYGAYRLCRFDAQGLAYFNATHEGFWRSFFSAVLIAPAHFLMTFLELEPVKIQASLARAILIEGFAYLVLVFAFPLAMYYVCQLIDRQRQYVMYIVAYNWAGVILTALALPAAVLGSGGLVPEAAGRFIELAVTSLTLVMLWYVARSTLQVKHLTAAALVAGDLVLSLLVRSIAEGRLEIA